jgi:uncharacterized membrane protein YesL
MGIVDAYGDLFQIVGMNLLWLVFTIPTAVLGLLVVQIATAAMTLPDEARTSVGLIFSLLLAVLLVLGPNPASAGIHLWAFRLVSEERVEFGLFWEGLRQYWRTAALLFLLDGVGLVLLIANALFYLNSGIGILFIPGIIFAYAIPLWLAIQMFALPLLIAQDDKRLRLVLRNSFFLAMANIIPTLTLFVVLTLLTLISAAVTLLIALVTACVVALILARALQMLLERYRVAAPAAE